MTSRPKSLHFVFHLHSPIPILSSPDSLYVPPSAASTHCKYEPDTCVPTLIGCSFPWKEGVGLFLALFNLGPKSCNQCLSSIYTPQLASTLPPPYIHPQGSEVHYTVFWALPSIPFYPYLGPSSPSLSLPFLTSVSPHVALEVEGIVKALATTAAHVAACRTVALEVSSQHALQWKGLGAEWAAKCPRAPGSGSESALHGLWEGCGS